MWTTSDGVYVCSNYPSGRKLRDYVVHQFDLPSDLLEMRQIVGLTSNARATVLRALDTFDGRKRFTAPSVSDWFSIEQSEMFC